MRFYYSYAKRLNTNLSLAYNHVLLSSLVELYQSPIVELSIENRGLVKSFSLPKVAVTQSLVVESEVSVEMGVVSRPWLVVEAAAWVEWGVT